MHTAEQLRRAMFGDSMYEKLEEEGAFSDGIACPPEEEQVRKEFQREVDVAYQLKAFQAGQAFPRQNPGPAVVNYDMDRLTALELLGKAEQLFSEFPPSVRERFTSWQAIEEAAISGELATFLKEQSKPREEPVKDTPVS